MVFQNHARYRHLSARAHGLRPEDSASFRRGHRGARDLVEPPGSDTLVYRRLGDKPDAARVALHLQQSFAAHSGKLAAHYDLALEHDFDAASGLRIELGPRQSISSRSDRAEKPTRRVLEEASMMSPVKFNKPRHGVCPLSVQRFGGHAGPATRSAENVTGRLASQPFSPRKDNRDIAGDPRTSGRLGKDSDLGSKSDKAVDRGSCRILPANFKRASK